MQAVRYHHSVQFVSSSIDLDFDAWCVRTDDVVPRFISAIPTRKPWYARASPEMAIQTT